MNKALFEMPHIAANAAIEVDNYVNKNPSGFENLEKIKDFLKKEQNSPDEIMFLWKSFRKNSQKNYTKVDEIKLEKKLMLYDIENIKHLSKEKLKDITDVLCNMTKYAIAEINKYSRGNYLAA